MFHRQKQDSSAEAGEGQTQDGHRPKDDDDNKGMGAGSIYQTGPNYSSAGGAGGYEDESAPPEPDDYSADEQKVSPIDVSIPPASSRLGIRFAGGGEQEPQEPQARESYLPRPFTGFNRLQPRGEKNMKSDSGEKESGQSPLSSHLSHKPNEPTNLQETAVNIQNPNSTDNSTYQEHRGYESSYQQTSTDAWESEGRQLLVGRGISLTGEIQECNHLVVEGRVEAALKGSKVLEIKQGGTFIGAVEIEQATIAGVFEGEITVNGLLSVTETGVITGTISYKELEIRAGAKLDGKLTPISSKNYKATAKGSEADKESRSIDEKEKSAKASSSAAGPSSKAEKKKNAELPLTEDV